MDNPVQINIVIPLYNEEKVFAALQQRLTELMRNSKLNITVIMIDDGSSDNTAQLMENLSLQDKRFTSVFLSRNFGHQLALSAGLSVVDATEAIFVIDGDLQDPPELLEDFYPYIKDGYDVVYAVREKRKESFFKKLAYSTFYKILKRVSNIDIPLDSGDFSLISRRVVDEIVKMKEESRFIRGMRTWVGYKQIGVAYERQSRHSGDSKYPLSKLLKLAFDGIFNFSELPIRFISYVGLLTILISISYLIFALLKMGFTGDVPEGFIATIFMVTLFGGIQLLSLGIIGEYILRIFFQVKERPLFIIKKRIYNEQVIL
ncbi:MAG: glycosyltransferase [Flexibacter sp. CG_4_10_14_3_um_filter_32_15]|nr:MAG: glycosyltransferase [Flexibacter sp. CG_4_10_14_3_um_filter_32_15]